MDKAIFKSLTTEQKRDYLVVQECFEEKIRTTISENKMEDGITEEDCLDRFMNVSLLYEHHTIKAWEYFKKIYNEIPQEHRLKVQLGNIYTCYHYNIREFYIYLKRSLRNETETQRNTRIENYKRLFKDLLNGNDSMTVYRGVNSSSMDNDLALSYTTSKEQAEWFADRFSFKGGATVIEKKCSRRRYSTIYKREGRAGSNCKADNY